MPITALPALDRTSVNFKANVDTFFGSQLPTFSTEAEAARVAINNNTTSASSSAATATTKASEAATSANNAATSKTGADTARDGAVVARTAAEAALDSFDDRYLGAKSAAPTLDNDGAALLVGALYWDTAIPGMRAYTGTAWTTLPAATAGAVANTAAGGIAATTVQAALNELDVEKANLASPTFTGTVGGVSAAMVTNAPAGNIAATTVQAALNELDTEKALASGSTIQPFSVATLNDVLPLHLNDIINGDFRIAQIGTSFAAPANGAYDLDGWQNGKAGLAVFTVSQAAGSTAGRLARQVTITTIDDATAVGDVVFDSTRIEGSNIEKYVGKTFTVAFRARVPVVGIHCVALRNGGVDRSYIKEINFPTANAWQDCSFTVVGGLPTAGTWNYTNGTGLIVTFAHQCGTDFQTTPDAWNTGSFYGTANQVNDCVTLSNVWAMEKVTLNLGTVAAVSEIDVGDELRRCMRYREPINLSGDIAISRQTGTQATSCPIPFAVPKRAAPTFSAFNTTTTLISISGAGVVAGTTTTANNITTTSFTALMTFGAFTSTAGYAVALGGTTAIASATL